MPNLKFGEALKRGNNFAGMIAKLHKQSDHVVVKAGLVGGVAGFDLSAQADDFLSHSTNPHPTELASCSSKCLCSKFTVTCHSSSGNGST